MDGSFVTEIILTVAMDQQIAAGRNADIRQAVAETLGCLIGQAPAIEPKRRIARIVKLHHIAVDALLIRQGHPVCDQNFTDLQI